MAKIPLPRWPSRTEWMIVYWYSTSKQWLPRFKPFPERQAARAALAEVRKNAPDLPVRLVRVHTNYTLVPPEEE